MEEREALIEKTFHNIEKLPTPLVQEVNDFVEFILQRTNNALMTEGLKQLSLSGCTCDFLHNEPELYSIEDLKVRFL